MIAIVRYTTYKGAIIKEQLPEHDGSRLLSRCKRIGLKFRPLLPIGIWELWYLTVPRTEQDPLEMYKPKATEWKGDGKRSSLLT